MDEFRLCSDGEFLPTSIPCPPPYSGPYYYYPYENIPLPPEQGSTDVYNSSPEGTPISSGAVAGIIIVVGFIFFMMCLIALKCRSRFIVGNIVRVSSRNARNNELGGELAVHSGDMLVNIVGCGLEEKLVNLLPVCEYVGLMQEGKMDGKERQECAVCLSLFEEKEIVRVLPKCHHIFHLHCIDKWFESHANCPLCRERITLQTIQLSFNSDKLNNPQPLDPAHPLPEDHASDDIAHQAPISDQHTNSPVLSDVCDGLAYDAQDPSRRHQNIFLAAASAVSINTPPHTAEDADYPARHDVGGHLAATDRDRTRLLCRIDCYRDHHSLSIPAGTAKPEKATHDEVNNIGVENASTQAARDECALYIGDGQSAGPVCSQLQSLYEWPHNQSAATNDRSHGAAASNWTMAAVNDVQSRSAPASDNQSVAMNDRSHGAAASNWTTTAANDLSRSAPASDRAGEITKRLQQGADAGSDSSDDHKNALASPPSPASKKFDKSLHHPRQLQQGSMISSYNSGGQFSSLRKSLSTGSLIVGVRDPTHTIPSSFSW